MVSTWPRLYLDTGDLHDIADGTADAAVVERLTSVCADRGVLLVISRSHFQDVLAVDEVTRDRFSTALERFRLRAVVMKGPEDFELDDADATQPADIVLEMAGNIRELTDASAEAPSVLRLGVVQTWLHEALAAVQLTRAQRGIRPLSQPAVILGWKCMLAIISGRNPTGDIAAVFEAERDGVEIEAWEREVILAEAQPFAGLLAKVEQMPDLPDDWRLTVLLFLRASWNPRADTIAPGQFLSARLNGSFARNIQRRPRPSDVVDMGHVSHFPYVDIATTDRAALDGIRRHLASINRPRSVRLFRNGQLKAVLEAVESLPDSWPSVLNRAT